MGEFGASEASADHLTDKRARHWISSRLLWIWLIIFGAMLVYKIDYCLDRAEPPVSDELTYLAIAENLNLGRGFSRLQSQGATAFVMPGYPFLVAILMRFSGGSLVFVYIVQVFMSAVIALAFGGLVFKWTSHARFAGLTSLLVFVQPAFFLYPQKILTEISFSAWFALSLLGWECVRLRSDSIRGWAAFGFFHAMAFMTRPVTAVLTPLIIIWAWLEGKPRNLRSFMGACCAVCVILGIWMPWCIRNYLSMERFIPLSTSSGFVLMAGSLEDVNQWQAHSIAAMHEAGIKEFAEDEARANQVILDSARQRIRQNRSAYFTRALKTSWRFWLSEYKILTGREKRFRDCWERGDWTTLAAKLTLLCDSAGIFLIAILSVPLSVWRPRYAPYAVLLVYFTVVHSLLIPIERYSVPLTGLVLALGVAGLHEIAIWWSLRRAAPLNAR